MLTRFKSFGPVPSCPSTRVARRATSLRSAAAVLLPIAACTGLDPGGLDDSEGPPDLTTAGYSFDAGVDPDSGSGSGGRGGGGSPSGGSSGSVGASDGGQAGEASGAEGGTTAVPGSGRGGAPNGIAGAGGAGDASGMGGSDAGASGSAGAAGQGTTEPPPPVHAFIISEYVEGSSSYKALEIWALADSTLAGCRLATYFNGSTTATGLTLDGTVVAGHGTVLCSSSLAALLGDTCQRSTNLSFNGDDAVALECNGRVIDSIGQAGADPGDAWVSGKISTLNQTLRRSCELELGDQDPSDAFDPALEWTSAGIDAFQDLGVRSCGVP